MEWFEFEIADEPFHLETHYIFQVANEAIVTPVPFVPDCYLGLIYFRGELFDVIDIAHLLGHKIKKIRPVKEKLILTKWENKKWAITADKVIGLVYLDSKDEDNKILLRKSEDLNVITPEMIMDRLTKEYYGPIKIRKNIYSGS